MDWIKEEQQRKDFCNILFDLAKLQNLLQDAHTRSHIYLRLEELYDAEPSEKGFRHFYSDIFYVLTEIQQDSELGNIDILGQNVDFLRKHYLPKNKAPNGNRVIDVSDSIQKLYDHVSLDIARISYSDGADRQISGESSLKNLQAQIKVLQEELSAAKAVKDDINEVKDKLDNAQKEYISILGIFASIVLAFTGGIAFSTSVLNNIAQVSIYRTIFLALIIGLVLVNILFGLFYYINALVNKRRKLYPLIISNAVIIVLLIVTFISWSCGMVESRNTRIVSPSDTSITEELPSSTTTSDTVIASTVTSAIE